MHKYIHTHTHTFQLRKTGLDTFDLTKNELSKEHVRFLAGGHAEVEGEEIYRYGVHMCVCVNICINVKFLAGGHAEV